MDHPGRQDPPNRPRPAQRRAAAAAVLGSMAALGGAGSAAAQVAGHRTTDGQRRQSRRADALPAGERALLGRVFSALSAQAPTVAAPVLDRGIRDGTISRTEADHFLARLVGLAAPAPRPPSPAAAALFQRVFAAIRAELPIVAGPIIGAGLADGTLSEPQAERLNGRFADGPRLGFGLVIRGAQAVGATRLP